MRPKRGGKRRSTSSSSPTRGLPLASSESGSSSRLSPSRASVLDRELLTEDDLGLFRDLKLSSPEPRSFPYSVKQQCWDKAEKIKGRDPDRWRRDPLGNTVFRKLVGCPGCLCHDYDHIVPYSKEIKVPSWFGCNVIDIFFKIKLGKGGKSTLENCQVLQATVNRSKGNRTEFSKAELRQKSSYCRVSGRDMDLLELSAYGTVRRAPDSGGCMIQ